MNNAQAHANMLEKELHKHCPFHNNPSKGYPAVLISNGHVHIRCFQNLAQLFDFIEEQVCPGDSFELFDEPSDALKVGIGLINAHA